MLCVISLSPAEAAGGMLSRWKRVSKGSTDALDFVYRLLLPVAAGSADALHAQRIHSCSSLCCRRHLASSLLRTAQRHRLSYRAAFSTAVSREVVSFVPAFGPESSGRGSLRTTNERTGSLDAGGREGTVAICVTIARSEACRAMSAQAC
jgi:hypothetical protein